MGFIINEDTLQYRIYVLNEHLTTIENDMHSFNFNKDNSKAKAGGFICEIIAKFYDKAGSTYTIRRNEEAALIKDTLNKKLDPKTADELSDMLIENYIKRKIKLRQNALHKTQKAGSSVRIKLNDSLINILSNSDENKYYDNEKDYMEMLIYEYCSLSYEERERIYFSKTISVIEDSISARKMLYFEYKNNKFSIKPYGIIFDNNVRYNYLVGLDPETNSTIVFRLGIIKNINTNINSYTLTEEEKEKIKNEIVENGVSYAFDKNVTSEVRLTDFGYNTLYSASVIAHQKPRFTKIIQTEKDNNILEFKCSEKHLYNYFIKYGKDAEILSPPELRQRFKATMDTAAGYYNRKTMSSD